jgi:hypothetical protein
MLTWRRAVSGHHRDVPPGRAHAAGNPSGFEPDGDSVQFRPTDQSLLERLTKVGRPYRLTSIGSTQLRFEGIDALELHFDGSHQPRPLADRARDFLTGELDDDAADKLADGAAQLVSDERLVGCPARAATIGVYDASVRGFPSCQSGHGFGLMLRCEECGREARTGEEARGWRTFLIVVKEGEPAEAVDYCPDCAKREFEDDR